jgi:hypothetical protein
MSGSHGRGGSGRVRAAGGTFSLSISLNRDPVTPLPIVQGTRAEAHA